MTRKERKALMSLLSIISNAAQEIDYYSIDYDVRNLGGIADKLREAVLNFRKEATV